MECPHVSTFRLQAFFSVSFFTYVIQTCFKKLSDCWICQKSASSNFSIRTLQNHGSSYHCIVGPRVVTFSILEIKLGYFVNVVCLNSLLNIVSLSMLLLFFGPDLFIRSHTQCHWNRIPSDIKRSSSGHTTQDVCMWRISHYIFAYFSFFSFLLCHFDRSIRAAAL